MAIPFGGHCAIYLRRADGRFSGRGAFWDIGPIGITHCCVAWELRQKRSEISLMVKVSIFQHLRQMLHRKLFRGARVKNVSCRIFSNKSWIRCVATQLAESHGRFVRAEGVNDRHRGLHPRLQKESEKSQKVMLGQHHSAMRCLICPKYW